MIQRLTWIHSIRRLWSVRRALSLTFCGATLGAISVIPLPAEPAYASPAVPLLKRSASAKKRAPASTTLEDALQSGLLHSHNDYEQQLPLQAALEQGFTSVEADVWLTRGDLKVSHMGFFFKGSLRRLYLEPLQRMVDEQGSVHGDGKPFYLWIDIKSGRGQVVEALQLLLSEYPCLSRFSENGFEQRAVTVILTGDEATKTRYVNSNPLRYATRDSNAFSANDPQGDLRWSWYSLPWKKHFHWNGRGPMPADQRAKLKDMVERIHAQGRRLRFWDSPQTQEFWTMALNARIDAIGTDNLSDLGQFFKNWLTQRPHSSHF